VNQGLNQTAIVTGGAKRTGREIAIALARRGFHIALHYRESKNEAQAVQEEIVSIGQKCLLIQADLFDLNEAINVIRQAVNQLPPVSLLVNNASIFERSDLLNTDLDSYERNFAIHLRSPFFMSCEFARHCKNGSIINILDAMILSNNTEYFAYLLSKKSLQSFTEMAAGALAPNIRVNAIAPGSTMEPIDDLESGYMEKRAKQIPLKIKGNPSYIVQGVNYLLDNQFVTGECLFIDGGAHLHYGL